MPNDPLIYCANHGKTFRMRELEKHLKEEHGNRMSDMVVSFGEPSLELAAFLGIYGNRMSVEYSEVPEPNKGTDDVG